MLRGDEGSGLADLRNNSFMGLYVPCLRAYGLSIYDARIV